MTRNHKEDPKVLEREYVFSPDHISLTELADKYHLARSGVADKARIGKWYEKRLEYQARVDHSVIEAMGQKWAEEGVALREKILDAAEKTLDAYIAGIESEKIKVDAKDAALMSQVIANTLAAIEAAARPTAVVIDGEAQDMDPEQALEAIQMAKRALARSDLQLTAGEDADAEPRSA